jgi:NUMOD3 motif
MKYGFVYIWFDRKHKRYYVGCRWGDEKDGYICSSPWMKASYKKRPGDFKRRILTRVYTNRKDLLEEEYRWLSMMKIEELHGPRYYNIHNRHFTHWSVDDVSRSLVGRKISKANKGNPKLSTPRPKTDEHRQKISNTLKGRPLGYERSQETRDKISANSKRLQLEGRVGMKGRKHTDNTKNKMSINNAMHDPAKRAKIGEANKGKVGLWLNNTKRMAKPGTELYKALLSEGYAPKQ